METIKAILNTYIGKNQIYILKKGKIRVELRLLILNRLKKYTPKIKYSIGI